MQREEESSGERGKLEKEKIVKRRLKKERNEKSSIFSSANKLPIVKINNVSALHLNLYTIDRSLH